MIKVNIKMTQHNEHKFYFECDFLSIIITQDNDIRLINRKGFVISANNQINLFVKDEAKENYTLFLILIKKILKHFKKWYPERYGVVKTNIEILDDSILN
jgi:hypothetical protein